MKIINWFRLLLNKIGFDIDTIEEAKTIGAVVIGVGKSNRFGICDGAEHDAGSICGVLQQITNNITVLSNSYARRSSVINAIKSKLDNDLLIIYYSGHGGSEHFNFTTEKDGTDEYLCLYDNKLMDDELWGLIQGAKKRVFMIFDCCHAEGQWRSANSESNKIVKSSAFTLNKMPSYVNALKKGPGVLVWAGCPEDKLSYGDDSGGVFTNGICTSFKKHFSYDKVFRLARRKSLRYQSPKKLKSGVGFGGKAFR